MQDNAAYLRYQGLHLSTALEAPGNMPLLVSRIVSVAENEKDKPLGKAIETPKAAHHHVDFQPASWLAKAARVPVTGHHDFLLRRRAWHGTGFAMLPKPLG